jgi:WD40 repeat protein
MTQARTFESACQQHVKVQLLGPVMLILLLAACVLQDGKTIISGWSDGKIRGFGPQSGKLLYTINDAHHKAVTAIAVTSDSNRIISGGEEGELHTLHFAC